MAKSKTEAKIQQEIFTYHWNNYPEQRGLLFMVHNEAMNEIRGNRLKSQGMVRGVSDMIYLDPADCRPIFMEIKSETGKQSRHQREWQESISEHGYHHYYIIRSLEMAKLICGWTR